MIGIAFFVLLVFILIIFCLNAVAVNIIFSKYPRLLLIAYIILFLLGLSWIGVEYWQLTQLNSVTVPFTQTRGNTLSFTFTPKSSGAYSVDLTFLNDTINKKYAACGPSKYSWTKNTEKECKKALIYRTISGTINNKPFSLGGGYQWTPYGNYYNHAIIGPALNISEFDGKKNSPIQMLFKVDASSSEIQSTRPAIVIGADVGSFVAVQNHLYLFLFLAIPFVFSSIFLFFKIVKNRKKKTY